MFSEIIMLKYTEKMKKDLNTLRYFKKIKSALSIIFQEKKLGHFDEFNQDNTRQLLKRLNMISMALLLVYVYYFFADVYLLRAIEDMSFRLTLIIIHLVSLLCSLLYLFIYRKIKSDEEFLQSKKAERLVYLFISFYCILGAAASLNSQKLTGNIDAYIIIIIGIAVLLHIRPVYTFSIFLITQISFCIGLSIVVENGNDFIMKQINSTATVIIAFFVSATFYTYRRNAFIHTLNLEAKENNFMKLFKVNPFPLVITSAVDGRILEVNDQALAFYGAKREDIPNFNAANFYRSDDERRPVIEELRKTGYLRNHIIQQKVLNGELKWVILNYELIDYNDEKCILTGVTDVTDLKRLEAELIQHASIDLLTGIYNRRSGISQMEELLADAKTEYFSFCLCFVDVNNLKVVNDKFGHAEGDYLIRKTCDVIKKHVGDKDIFFRFGGDEFIIVFRRKNTEEVHSIWHLIADTLASIQKLEKKPYPFSASHGLFYYEPGTDITIEDMIRLADEEMYREKNELKKLFELV